MLLGVVAGSAAMGAWVGLRPSFLAAPELPGDWLLSLAVGAGVLKAVAPRAPLLALGGGVCLLIPAGAAMSLVGTLAKMTWAIKLSKAEREALRQEACRIVDLGHAARASGAVVSAQSETIEDPDKLLRVIIPPLKLAFAVMCAPNDTSPDTGQPVLSRAMVLMKDGKIVAADGREVDFLDLNEGGKRAAREMRLKHKMESQSATNVTPPEEGSPRFGVVSSTNPARYKHREALLANTRLAIALFMRLTVDRAPAVTFAEFASALLRMLFVDESPVLRADLWFGALDLNNDGIVSREELTSWVRKAMAECVVLKPASGSASASASASAAGDAVVARSGEDSEDSEPYPPATPEEVAESWLATYAGDPEGGITREEFDRMAEAVGMYPGSSTYQPLE